MAAQENQKTMLEVNPLFTQIKDMQGRTDVLRGYL